MKKQKPTDSGPSQLKTLENALRRLPYQPADPKSYQPGIGLIGCGAITVEHLRAYRAAGYNVLALCDVDQKRAEERKAEFYPDATVVTDYQQVLDRDDIEVVDITTHPPQRPPLVEAALRSGKHVLSQKPFVTDLAVGRRLADLADAQGVLLAVNQNGRWAPHFSLIRQAVAAGLIGEVTGVHLAVYWDHSWIGGTPFEDVRHLILYDFAIHWFDITMCFMRASASASEQADQSGRADQPISETPSPPATPSTAATPSVPDSPSILASQSGGGAEPNSPLDLLAESVSNPLGESVSDLIADVNGLELAAVDPAQPLQVCASIARSAGQTVKPDMLGEAIVNFPRAQASLVFNGDVKFGPTDRTVVTGTKGTLISDGPDLDHQQLTLVTADGAVSGPLEGSWFPDGFHGTMGELLCAIEEGREPSHSARNNLDSLALCFAAVESADRGKPAVPGRVQRLPADAG